MNYELYHFKLKMGKDVLALIDPETLNEGDKYITMHCPVSYEIVEGTPFMRDVLHLSDAVSVSIERKDLWFVYEASDNAIDAYNKFIEFQQEQLGEGPTGHDPSDHSFEGVDMITHIVSNKFLN